MIGVLLAGDRDTGALARLLALEHDLVVVARVEDGDAVVDAALVHRPDAVLLDIDLPGRPALETAAALRTEAPDCRVLVLTPHARPGDLTRALAAGAAGYLVKDGPVPALAEAIRASLRGETVIDPALAAGGGSAE